MAVPYRPFRQAGRSRSTPRLARPGSASSGAGAPASSSKRSSSSPAAVRPGPGQRQRGQPGGRERAREPGGGDQALTLRPPRREVGDGRLGLRPRRAGRLRWRGDGEGRRDLLHAGQLGQVLRPGDAAGQELRARHPVVVDAVEGHDEVVTGAGAGHVEQADALVLVHLLVDGAGGVEPGLLQPLAEAEDRLAVGAEGHLHAAASPAGRAVEAAHDGDRELQALGAVDGQDPHRLVARAAPAVVAPAGPVLRRPRRPRARPRPPGP